MSFLDKPRQTLPVLFLVLAIGYNVPVKSQDTLQQVERFILPLVFYTPETTWSFGLAGVMTFPIDSLSPRSQLQLGAAYTLQKQLLFYLPFQLYWQRDRRRFTGELGYYRYNYFFYGVGNEFADYAGELYGVNFPRVRVNALWRTGRRHLTGLRYAWDYWQVYDQEVGGLLLEQEEVVGRERSVYSALGAVWQWDSRDHIFFPRSGSWLELAVLNSNEVLGATQNFIKWSIDARTYWNPKNDRIWAAQLYVEGNTGSPPFNQLALLGGTRLLRGYYEGRFRDRQLSASQIEYRFPIKGRFGAVLSGGIGSVTDNWASWQGSYIRYALGGGLRFILLPEDQIRLRLDYGIGPNSSAFYLTVGADCRAPTLAGIIRMSVLRRRIDKGFCQCAIFPTVQLVFTIWLTLA